MKRLFVLLAMLCALWPNKPVFADKLQWPLPYGIGTVQIPVDFKDAIPLAGVDILQRRAIAGAAVSLLTLRGNINGYVGLVGDFHTQAPNAQPYIALGADILKYIHGIGSFENLQLHGFTRWTTDSGGSFESHLGAGLALAYKFK